MKITLNFEDRLSIAQFLPTEGGRSEVSIGAEIIKKTFISEAERKEIIPDNLYPGKVTQNTNKEKEFDFSKEEFDLMYTECLHKESSKKLTPANIGLANKLLDAKVVDSKK